MATKNRKFMGKSTTDTTDTAGGEPVRFQGKYTFINCDLNAEDKQWLKDNLPSRDNLAFDLIADAQAGYKFSLDTDLRGGGYIASLSCNVVGMPNCGHTLTARGSGPVDAVYALYYKHFIKLSGQWDAVVSGGDAWG